MVSAQAMSRFPATPQWTADRRLVEPTPKMLAVMVWVVLTGALYHLGDEGPLTREPLGQRAGAPGEAGPEGGALRGGAPGEAGSDADGLRGCVAGGKETFIARIVDFVRHANARPGALG